MKNGQGRRRDPREELPSAKKKRSRTDEPPGIILSPEEEARLVERLRECRKTKPDEWIPWEKIRAEWGI